MNALDVVLLNDRVLQLMLLWDGKWVKRLATTNTIARKALEKHRLLNLWRHEMWYSFNTFAKLLLIHEIKEGYMTVPLVVGLNRDLLPVRFPMERERKAKILREICRVYRLSHKISGGYFSISIAYSSYAKDRFDLPWLQKHTPWGPVLVLYTDSNFKERWNRTFKETSKLK